MRKRWPWIALGVLAGSWLVPAVFVAVYDPDVPRPPGSTPGSGPALARDLEPQLFLLSHGYAKQWTVETWEGKDGATADKTSATYAVAREPLDRRAGTFRFTLWCRMDHAGDLEGVRLFVTSESDWSGEDGAIWTQVAEATVRKPGGEIASLTCEATVPASTTAYRLVEVRDGRPCCGFSQSMLTAPTLLGRVYDRIAWSPLFRWVPDLR